mmetsp:Transcript_6361/g.29062  ORF Transcript_6361/g.29062 Transcript_6361/m.29062 type:complete len:344 (+) Transcript_6361:3389-4420(+)
MTSAGARIGDPSRVCSAPSSARTSLSHASKSPEPVSVTPSTDSVLPKNAQGIVASDSPRAFAAFDAAAHIRFSTWFAPYPRYERTYTLRFSSRRSAGGRPRSSGDKILDVGSATICALPPPTSSAPTVWGTASASGAPTEVMSRPESWFAASHAKNPSSSPSIVRKCDRSFSTRSPPPSNPRRNLVRLDTTLATDAHSALCSSSDSTRTPAVAQRYSGVASRSSAGTLASARSSIGTIASATASSPAPASDASGVCPFTFLPIARSWNRGLAAPGTISNVCARHPVDPASTITTCRGASDPHIASADASTYDEALHGRARADAKTRRAAKTTPRSKPQTTIAR